MFDSLQLFQNVWNIQCVCVRRAEEVDSETIQGKSHVHDQERLQAMREVGLDSKNQEPS